MASPTLSVIIPTFNRRQRLGQVLEALQQQTLESSAFEVVVIDDGSTDGTAEWLRAQNFRFRLRPETQSNGGPAQARNKGVHTASGRLVVFIDDDVVPIPELLAQHLASHDAEPHDLAVIGPLASLPHYPMPWVAWEQAKVEKQYQAMLRGDYPPTFRQFWTGNASVARHHVIGAGLFDVSLRRAEDIELGLRLKERGVQFRFNPEARGFHHVERSLASWSNTYASYGELEVQILGRLGEHVALETLAANFRRLRPEVRVLLRCCVGRQRLHALTTRALSAFLETSTASSHHEVSLPVCSALANLLYWQASYQKMGPGRFGELLRCAKMGGD